MAAKRWTDLKPTGFDIYMIEDNRCNEIDRTDVIEVFSFYTNQTSKHVSKLRKMSPKPCESGCWYKSS